MEKPRQLNPRVSEVDHRMAAWSLCALSLVLTALGLWLVALNHSHPNNPTYAPWLDNTLSALSYAPVGALVASRRPDNPIGWLVCLYGLVISMSYFSAEYTVYALQADPARSPPVRRWSGSSPGCCPS